MVGEHQPINGHEFEQAQGDSEGQWGLECCVCAAFQLFASWTQLNNWTTTKGGVFRNCLVFRTHILNRVSQSQMLTSVKKWTLVLIYVLTPVSTQMSGKNCGERRVAGPLWKGESFSVCPGILIFQWSQKIYFHIKLPKF